MEVEPRWIRGITATSLVLLAAMIVGLSVVHGQATSVIARGGGTTIIHGGTGSPGFVPVITTIAFHATRSGNSASGSFECLAEAPEAGTGSKSAQFTVNAMYVTGLGAGSNVPFTFVVQKGGPGAASVLTVDTLPKTPFHEILLQGSFEVAGQD